MNPATQASACRASTSEFRSSTWPTSCQVPTVSRLSGATAWDGGSDSAAMAHTLSSRQMLTATEPRTQVRSTGQGARFHSTRARRVSRQPWTRAKWDASITD